MLKKIEIIIANSETGEIYHRHHEVVEMDKNCNPLSRFHLFADGFYRVLCDSKKYSSVVIQLSASDFVQPIQQVIDYVY